MKPLNSPFLRRLMAPALVLLLPIILLLALPAAAFAQEGAIVAPAAGERVSGWVNVTGFAQHPEFRKWQLDLLVNGDPEQAHFLGLAEEPAYEPAAFTAFDSAAFPDGQHVLRLRVVHTNLNYEEFYSPIVVANGGANSAFVETALAAAEAVLAEATAEEAAPEPEITGPVILDPEPIIRTDVPAGERWIQIDLSDQRLRAYQGAEVVFETTVSTGKEGWRTLPGTFAVYLKYPKARMVGEDYDTPDVPWTMYYSGDFAIHGAYWHNDFGTPVSHGCVNLRVDESQALYEWAAMGTRVVVIE